MVKFGIVVGMLGSALLVPWSAMVALQIARMEEGRRVPLWAIFAFGAGCVNAVAFILPFIFWAGAFYRPNRSPELVQLINDITWLEFLMFFPTFSMQLFCLAMAGFTQRQGPQVFPRWFLYLNLWMAMIGGTGAHLHLLLLRTVRLERHRRILASRRLVRPVPHGHVHPVLSDDRRGERLLPADSFVCASRDGRLAHRQRDGEARGRRDGDLGVREEVDRWTPTTGLTHRKSIPALCLSMPRSRRCCRSITADDPQERARRIVDAVVRILRSDAAVFRALLSGWSYSGHMLAHDPTNALISVSRTPPTPGTSGPMQSAPPWRGDVGGARRDDPTMDGGSARRQGLREPGTCGGRCRLRRGPSQNTTESCTSAHGPTGFASTEQRLRRHSRSRRRSPSDTSGR